MPLTHPTTAKAIPILLPGPMVRANLEGRKTMTRRIVEPQPVEIDRAETGMAFMSSDGRPYLLTGCGEREIAHRFGQPGDLLWVRETTHHTLGGDYVYAADYPACAEGMGMENIPPADSIRWTPSIHMPRWACRLVLRRVGDVRVERLHQITDADAQAEGIERLSDGRWKHYTNSDYHYSPPPKESFSTLWEAVNGKGSWMTNPWVYVIPYEVAAKDHPSAQALLKGTR